MVSIIGTTLGITGYDIHCRNLANAINKITPCSLQTNLVPNWNMMVNDKELEMIKRKPDGTNLLITHPVHWRMNLTDKNLAFCIWEGDKVPDYFIDEMLNPRINNILVASTHTRNAIVKTLNDLGTLTNLSSKYNDIIIPKIVLAPHGVDTEVFYPKDKPKKTTFLINKGWRNLEDRGGTQYALKAYMEEFTDKDDVSLILKVNPAYGIPDLHNMISALTNRKTNLPEIIIDVGAYELKDMVNLYNRANIFVATTRAEAYHLGCIEAMACGLPCIATNYGGQTDFITEQNGWLIDYDLEEVKHDIMYEGCKWATPRIESIRQAMRKAHNDKELVRIKGELSLQTAKNNSWDNTAKIISEL